MNQNHHVRLSRRQRQCLEGVAELLDSHQIAGRLGISPHTVDGHIAAAVAALGAKSRRDAVRIWQERQNGDFATGERLTGQFPPLDQPLPAPPDQASPAVREIDWPQGFAAEADHQVDRQGERDEQNHRILVRLAILAGIIAALMIILIAAPELGNGAQLLANLIQPFHQHK